MKKLLFSLGLCCLLLFGCSQNNNSTEYKDEAIKLYVENNNKLIASETTTTKISGNVKLSKGALIKQDIDQPIQVSLLANNKQHILQGNINTKVDDKAVDYKFYYDSNYFYLIMGNQAMKFKLPSTIEENKAINIDEANKIFDAFKNAKYTKIDDDGVNVEGYEISGEVSLNDLMKLSHQTGAAIDKEAAKIINGIKVHLTIYVPLEITGQQTLKVDMNINNVFIKASINDLIIQVTPSKEKVTIDKNVIKNAIDMSNMEGVPLY